MKRFFWVCLIEVGIIAACASPVYASTGISGTIDRDTVLTAEGSPYLLDGVVEVVSGVKLTIEQGVELKSDPETESLAGMSVAGNLEVRGTLRHPVVIRDLSSVTINAGRADITNARISLKQALTLIQASTTIASSTISDAQYGLDIRGGSVSVYGSAIKGNQYGVIVWPYTHLGDLPSSEADPSQIASTSVVISDSSFLGNHWYSVGNSSSDQVDARNNWWGTSDGPTRGFGSSSNFSGDVRIEPWLDHDPTAMSKAACCSSVLFLPGLQATRLYRDDERLWEPLQNDDVRSLFLNTYGSSIDASIRAGDPIGKALGFIDVYGSFGDFMDRLVAGGVIKEWRPFGYDWRMPVSQIASASSSLVETVRALASSSPTGKVTIIAHSNGGLVAKYLMYTLVQMGQSDLVGTLVSVAVPYLGTPQAIASLLYGEGEEIAHGLILRRSAAKEFGFNMASAYGLLPSMQYFKSVLSQIGPTIARTFTAVSTFVDQSQFLASVLNPFLIHEADSLHHTLDGFSWPYDLERWAIAGWGWPTIRGVSVDSEGDNHESRTTSLGDGTVVLPSAVFDSADSGKLITADLGRVSQDEDATIVHYNVLSSKEIQGAIGNIVKGERPDLSSGMNFGVGTTSEKTYIVVSTHSPVRLHLYDQEGRHTGTTQSDSLFISYETKIPGSSFRIQYSDGHVENHIDPDLDFETYITVPDMTDVKYTAAITGMATSTFTFRVERVRGGLILDSVEYRAVPITTGGHATTTISGSEVITTDFQVSPVQTVSPAVPENKSPLMCL